MRWSSYNQVGGIDAGAANTIAFSASNGVTVASGTGNAVLGDSIFANTGLGIDLGLIGVTVNDLGDLDSGPNNLQNFPILSAARNIGSSTIIQGTLNSRSNTLFRIEFFSNTNCHPSGFGQGRTFLNATTATTDSFGSAPIFFHLSRTRSCRSGHHRRRHRPSDYLSLHFIRGFIHRS